MANPEASSPGRALCSSAARSTRETSRGVPAPLSHPPTPARAAIRCSASSSSRSPSSRTRMFLPSAPAHASDTRPTASSRALASISAAGSSIDATGLRPAADTTMTTSAADSTPTALSHAKRGPAALSAIRCRITSRTGTSVTSSRTRFSVGTAPPAESAPTLITPSCVMKGISNPVHPSGSSASPPALFQASVHRSTSPPTGVSSLRVP